MTKYCKCKIQNAPIYKRIKGIPCFICYHCGKIREINTVKEITDTCNEVYIDSMKTTDV